MKTYVNREECHDILCIFTFASHLKHMEEAWKQRNNLADTEAAHLEQAIEEAFQCATAILRRLSRDQVEKIKRSINTWEVKLVPKATADLFKQQVQQEISATGSFCSTEALEGLAEMAIEGCCHPCVLPQEQRAACPNRAVFLELEIPMFDENPAPGACPYHIQEGGDS